MPSEATKAFRRAVSGQDEEPVTVTTDETTGSTGPADPPEMKASQVIAALQRQIADLSYRLALAEAEVVQHRTGGH